MQFGDTEWFEMLEQRAKFPCVFAFYITIEKDQKTVHTLAIKSNPTNIKNIQYRTIKPSYDDMALANVMWCQTTQEYYEECKRLMGIWGIMPKAPDSTAIA